MDREYTSTAPGYDSAGGFQRGAQSLNKLKPVNPSCFGTIEDAAANVVALVQRVQVLVDRLAGPAPEASNTSHGEKLKGVPNGLFDTATEQAISISNATAAANAALNRLEKHLP